MCIKDLNSLKSFRLIEMTDGFDLKPTGKLPLLAGSLVYGWR
jgi:hypothetical protein